MSTTELLLLLRSLEIASVKLKAEIDSVNTAIDKVNEELQRRRRIN